LDGFHRIEACCSRFDPQSEAMQLTTQIGVAVPVSDMLFEAVRFAVNVAEESCGAFDPTVGHQMETLGFNREYRTGQIVRTAIEPDAAVSYRDIYLDPALKTITLLRPLILDLGAVAKGLAIDLAARELRPARQLCDRRRRRPLSRRPTAGRRALAHRHPPSSSRR
jgi:thiamine biosynthesis lipoprotein